MLHALGLDLANGFEAEVVLYECLEDGPVDEVDEEEGDEEVLPDCAAVEDVGQTHTECLLH